MNSSPWRNTFVALLPIRLMILFTAKIKKNDDQRMKHIGLITECVLRLSLPDTVIAKAINAKF